MNPSRASRGNCFPIALSSAIALALHGPLSLAQDATSTAPASSSAADSSQLEEVVITAQKRVERLEDVPVSAAVVSNSTLQNSNVSDISDLNKLVPSVNVNGTLSGRAPLGIRGISSVSNEQAVGVPSGVAIMIDGVPVPSDSDDGNGIEDAQSIEVLKGPQATLGGRTAAAGVVNYRTYDPTDHLAGGVTTTATTDREFRGSGYISGPISNDLEYSLSAYDANRYYPIINEFYGTKDSQHDWGVRGKLLWNITDGISVKLAYHHATVKETGDNLVYVYLTPGSDLLGLSPLSQSVVIGRLKPSWSNLNFDSPVTTADHRSDDNDAQLDLSFDLGGGYTLTSTSAYQHESQREIQDLFATDVYFFDTLLTGTPVTKALPTTSSGPPFFNDQQLLIELITQRSEELKLVSPLDQPFSYVAGLFYSDTSVAMDYQRGFVGAFLDLPNVEPTTATYDVYGRGTWKIAPSTSLVTGLRYNFDRLSYAYDETDYMLSSTASYGPLYSSGSNNSSAVVGDVSVQQQFASDVMGYATYARGYSPKVYNTAAPIVSDTPLQPVGQEHIDHFEVGTKGSYLNHRLTANVSVFDTIYHDYQINSYLIVPNSISGILNIDAAGEAETRGLEFDTNLRATELTTLSLSTAYVDAVFKHWKNAPCVPYYPAGAAGTTTNCTFTSGAGYTQDMSGKTMPNAPRWKLYLDAQQRVPLGGAPMEVVLDGNWAYRTSAQMLSDSNPAGVMGAFGIVNLSVGIQGSSGKWSVTTFCNNVFNKIYYQDVEDFWSAPWQTPAGQPASTVIAQPARDAQRYGGVRLSVSL